MAENVIDMEEEKKQLEEERIQAYVNKPIDVKFEEAGAQRRASRSRPKEPDTITRPLCGRKNNNMRQNEKAAA